MPEPAWRRYLRFWRPDVQADVDEEVAFHLDMRADDYQRRGLSPDEARRAARTRFGDVAGVTKWLTYHDRQRDRARRREETVHELRRDSWYALRTLSRRRGFAAVAVLTLALGIGLTSALFSVVDAVLLRPLPYRDAERLVVLWQHDRRNGVEREDVAPGNFIDWRERSTGFVSMAAAEPYGLDYLGEDGPETLRTWRVSEDFFATLGTPASVGRGLGREDFTGAFSLAALVLAAVGVFGVMSGATAERTREMGVRLALGARPAEVLALVLRDGASLAVAGIALGAAISFAGTRLLRAMLFGVEPLDPLSFVVGVAVILASAMAATLVPAFRAARVDPIVTLRGD